MSELQAPSKPEGPFWEASPRLRDRLNGCVHECPLRSYDVAWFEVCADNVTKFEAQQNHSKPLFVLFKCGLEVARMANGANGNELARLVAEHCGEKKPA